MYQDRLAADRPASLRLEEGRRKGAPVVSQYHPGSRL